MGSAQVFGGRGLEVREGWRGDEVCRELGLRQTGGHPRLPLTAGPCLAHLHPHGLGALKILLLEVVQLAPAEDPAPCHNTAQAQRTASLVASA